MSKLLSVNINIRNRLILGFAAVILILGIAVGTTLVKVGSVQDGADRIVQLRVPTAFSSSGLVNNINASLAALRGWMLVDNPAFKVGRAAIWAEIHETRAEIDRLSAKWTNPDNVAAWTDLKATLDEFEAAQQRVEDIAHTIDQTPATKLLLTEAAPQAAVIIKSITAMIDAEAELAATPERKALLGMMADVRGTMGMALANIRAYLLSGDVKFKEQFESFWAKNEKRFADLKAAAYLLSPGQRTAFEQLSQARKVFSPLPPKMFEIRGSEKWNMANYLLVTEAAPRAGKLLTVLSGDKQEDGSRAGGMVDNQLALLAGDAQSMAGDISTLKVVEWLLLAAGLAVASAITFFTARAIVTPIREMTGAMGRLAEGDTSIAVTGADRSDEIGEMAAAVQVFKDNAIEKERMDAEKAKEQAAKEAQAKRMTELCATFDKTASAALEAVGSAAGEMETTAQSMTATAEETSVQATAVAAASEQAAGNVATVASAAEELSVVDQGNCQPSRHSRLRSPNAGGRRGGAAPTGRCMALPRLQHRRSVRSST